jgi:transposase-like protein
VAEHTKEGQPVSTPKEPVWEQLEGWVREQIQGLLQQVLEEEVTDLLGRCRCARKPAVDAASGYRNGHGQPRRVSLTCGTVEVRRPRVRGLEDRFESRLLPMFARRTREVGQLLPELYLHGLALGDFELALRGLLGEGAPLSPASVNRLRVTWEDQFAQWNQRRLDDRQLVYAWADGIYVKAGLEKDKAALLVIVGALSDGRKEVLAVVAGFRESTASWLTLLRSLRDRGLQPPRLLIADGGMGIWSAADQVWPDTAQQRCWNHKVVNVLDKLPKRLQAQAKELLTPIPYAPSCQEAERQRDRFVTTFQATFPAAVDTLGRDWERMVSFYAFPQAHWKHLRTSNPVESPFAAVRLRTEAGKRYKKVPGATALIWRLLMVAEKRFRHLDATEILPAVFAGQRYADGKPITPPQPAVPATKKEAA